MTRIVVKKLMWDEDNTSHIQKHNVSQIEIIEASKNLIFHKHTYSSRYLIVGRSGSRLLSLVVSRKGSGLYYLVTARDAGKNERKVAYEKEK